MANLTPAGTCMPGHAYSNIYKLYIYLVGQMRYLTVSVSSASALLSTNLPSVLLTAVPVTSSYPTPGPLMSTTLVKTGQPYIRF